MNCLTFFSFDFTFRRLNIFLMTALIACHFHGEALENNPKGKILICGVCKDVEPAIPCTIRNAEELGNLFEDYRVVIYENNSKDKTNAMLSDWASKNPKVIFKSETLLPEELAISRTDLIARARNHVLNIIRMSDYADFDYLVMVDLDFQNNWPISEIVATTQSEIEWDCVSANGIRPYGGHQRAYWDRYAFRSTAFPFGPEIMGDGWWGELERTWFPITTTDWMPVYSAFGGLAIYKTATILDLSYSGVVTMELQEYYKRIFNELPESDGHRKHYLQMNGLSLDTTNDVPIFFRRNTTVYAPHGYPHIICCEHIPLHAAMSLKGHGKFYINPQMVLRY